MLLRPHQILATSLDTVIYSFNFEFTQIHVGKLRWPIRDIERKIIISLIVRNSNSYKRYTNSFVRLGYKDLGVTGLIHTKAVVSELVFRLYELLIRIRNNNFSLNTLFGPT